MSILDLLSETICNDRVARSPRRRVDKSLFELNALKRHATALRNPHFRSRPRRLREDRQDQRDDQRV